MMHSFSEFDEKWDQENKRWKRSLRRWVLLVVGICILYVAVMTVFINKQHEKGEFFYTITVHTFQGDQTYMATKVKSQDSGCITFINMLGMEQTACGNFTVTQY